MAGCAAALAASLFSYPLSSAVAIAVCRRITTTVAVAIAAAIALALLVLLVHELLLQRQKRILGPTFAVG